MQPEKLYNIRNIDGAILVFNDESSLEPLFLSIPDVSWDLEKRLGLHLKPGEEGVYLISIPASDMEKVEGYLSGREKEK